MTLSERNLFFKAGIFLSAAALIIIVIAAFAAFPVYPELSAAAGRRSSGIFQALISRLLRPAPYAPLVTAALSAAYALMSMILIYYFFEKTQSPEILFFAFFILSFAFEAARVMAPVRFKYELPAVYLIMAYRVLIFGRYFGIFSLFAASVYAAGLQIQKQGNFIFIIAVTTLVIVLGVPIDGLSWDSSLGMVNGYSSMFTLVETGIIIITMVSFFVSAYTRGAGEFIFIGIGSLLVFLGRNLLVTADTWATPFPGLIFLGLGTWLISSYLHRIYLWL
jgi:hypothetical protein